MSNIQRSLLNNIDDKYDKSNGSFVFDIINAIAKKFEEQDEQIIDVLNSLDIENLEGEELEKFVYQRAGIKRKPATKATTIVEIHGAPSAKIEKGSLVAANDIFYVVDETTTLNSEGFASVGVTCQSEGAIGNVPVGAINSFPITIEGITTVNNSSVVNNGYEKENDEDLRNRYYEKLQKPGKAGNEYHYLEWAKSVTGVGKVKVFPRHEGPLTVKVSILTSNTEIASPELIESVSNYISTQKPFGSTVTVTTGTELKINISVSLTIEPSYSLETLKPIIKETLQKYLKSLTYEASYISYAQIGKEILSVQGVQDYSGLLINGATDNILLSDEQVPVVGEFL